MSDNCCPRLWQVEAARDGRLTGSELSNALRHRGQCADCQHAARTLDDLGRKLKLVAVVAVPPLVRKRTRQALLSAWNEHLLSESPLKARSRILPIVALCAVAGAALAIAYPRLRSLPGDPGASLPQPSSQLGFASTASAASSAEPPAPALSLPLPLTASAAAKPRPGAASPKNRVATARAAPPAASVPNSAEDDVYLQIVALLRSRREAEARAKAEQYLLQFPSGFRRLEVENIAKRRQ